MYMPPTRNSREDSAVVSGAVGTRVSSFEVIVSSQPSGVFVLAGGPGSTMSLFGAATGVAGTPSDGAGTGGAGTSGWADATGPCDSRTDATSSMQTISPMRTTTMAQPFPAARRCTPAERRGGWLAT